MKKLKKVINAVVTLALFIGIAIFMYKAFDKVDISGTIIAKDKIAVGKGSQVCLFAIHPDDYTRFTDFDIEVPLYKYVKYEVGDKIVFRDVSTFQKLKNPEWYNKVEVDILLTFLLSLILLAWVWYLAW